MTRRAAGSRLRPLALACVVALAAACDDDTATSPSSGAPPTFRAVIGAAREVPPVTGPEALGTGVATVTLRSTRDANGVVTGGTLDFVIELTGFPPGTIITAAQIQVGGAAANGAVVQDSGLAARGGATLASGSGRIEVNGVPVSGLVANALLANAAGYYVNVRSTANPAGAARGQLALP